MSITFSKRTESSDLYADCRNNHTPAQWKINYDGEEVGFIVGEAGNWGRSANWHGMTYTYLIENRKRIGYPMATCRSSYTTLRDLKAGILADLSPAQSSR
jgi:hypothetical protein